MSWFRALGPSFSFGHSVPSRGSGGLISRHRNRTGNRALKSSVASDVLEILRQHYPDFGPTLAAEKLRERHGILIAKETVRQLQIASGLWLPRKLRAPRIDQPRTRPACPGELIQIDGCEHRWFEDHAPMCTTLVYVGSSRSIKDPLLQRTLPTRIG